MQDNTRIALFSKRSKFFDDEVDLGKLDWIAQLTPEQALKAGERLDEISFKEDEEFEAELNYIFSNKRIFANWLNNSAPTDEGMTWV